MNEADFSFKERAYASIRRFYLNSDTIPSIKAIGIGILFSVFSWYVLSSTAGNPYQPSKEAQALIEQQKGIQSLVCDPSNTQHFNPEECEISKGLEARLYWK